MCCCLSQLDEERQKNERMARVAEHQKKIDNEMLEGVKGERDGLCSKLQNYEKEMSLLQEQLSSVRVDLNTVRYSEVVRSIAWVIRSFCWPSPKFFTT